MDGQPPARGGNRADVSETAARGGRRSDATDPPAAIGSPLGGTFLASLSEGERESLYRIGVVRSHTRGAVLIFQGEVDDRTMILLAGRVKVARVEQDGRELMLDIRDPGDLLGELAFIDGGSRVATVTALEPVQALVTPARTLRRHLETTPRLAVVLLEILAHRFRESSVRRSQFATADTMGRLAARILDLADRYGEPSEEGIRLTSPLSQEDLAAWTGASRAGVAEALRTMRELGWVQTDRRKILVRNSGALRERAA
jgi:CRP/FNR family transcriptional regulator, cyclic AMP receptor protein